MTLTFFFAPGSRPSRTDLDVAFAVGQRDFLVPVGSRAIPPLRHRPGVRVALDSAAWPPNNPDRPSLAEYAEEIRSWRQPDGTWGNLAWAATYDHIGDPAATLRDDARLRALLTDLGAADAPIASVIQHPAGVDAVIAALAESHHARTPPIIGIGGLVPVLSPSKPATVQAAADAWFDAMLVDLESAIDAGDLPVHTSIHLFGIARPAFVLRSARIASFDTSGPLRAAQDGWTRIEPRYTPRYGISAECLQTSRAARLAFWLIETRARAGLPWRPMSPAFMFQPDRVPSPFVQLTLHDLLAA